MYDLQFVRKRRRRRIAALVSLISAIGVASLVTISFLGRTVGTFTVSLQSSSVRLALSEKEDFANQTSYLRIGDLPATYYEFSYDWFPGFDQLDNETNDYMYGSIKDSEGEVRGLQFLKYTFYVKNVGNTPAAYTLSINLDDCTQAGDGTGRTLDDTIRVMVFENDPTIPNSHEFDVYAKDVVDTRYQVRDIENKPTNREFVWHVPAPIYDEELGASVLRETKDYPLAKSFNSGTAIVKKSVKGFDKGDIMRYTLVYWLEGEDPQATYSDKNEPKGAKIKLSVTINANSYTYSAS